MKFIFRIFILIVLPFAVFADVKLPSIIADGMVLQQQARVSLWGWASPGEKITVKENWSQQFVTTTASDKGEWAVKLKTPKAGGPYTLVFNGINKIEVNNVLIGEVWLCSGQSNMEFPLQKITSWKTGVFNYESEIAKANYPKMRMFTVKHTVAQEPQKDVEGNWAVCSPETAGNFSAVAYYFGKALLNKLNCPIGLIHASWGGTPAESWVKQEVLANDTNFLPILKRYNQEIENYPKAMQAYETTLSQWKANESIGKVAAPKKPVAPLQNSKSPVKLYNGMIAPLIPFTLKGVIWYQGESNSPRAYQYRKLFPALIESWRKEWKNDFPFYFVQIAMHYKQSPEIREAQLLTLQSIPQTGMAVITDVSDSLDIHPRNKEVPGNRLARIALAKTYHQQQLEYAGPLYQSMKIEGDYIIIKFAHANGLMAKGSALSEFTIAGQDRAFAAAKAVIKGNEIWVSSPSVKAPISVRFAWKNYARPNLFNSEGLPASPFRTDNWPGETMGEK
ncbi:MAG: sialate O-acetylesterase [Bacteroidota bacterium]